MSHRKSDAEQYQKDLGLWQKNMYQPGAYLGGDIPPDIKYGGRKFGYAIMIQGLVAILVGILMVIYTEYKLQNALIIILGLGIFYGGFNRIRRSKRR